MTPKSCARRRLGWLVGAVVLLAAGAVRAQPGGELTVRTEGRVTVVVRPRPPAAVGAAGGLAGAVAPAHLRRTEAALLLQADGATDVRIEGAWRAPGGGAEHRLELLAEEAVVRSRPVEPGAGLPAEAPVRSIYAHGFVRLEVTAPGEAVYLFQADELLIDVQADQILLAGGELRVIPLGASPGAPPPVVRAGRLRVDGLARATGEDVSVAVCDHGEPHFALHADRAELEALRPPAPGALRRLVPGLGGGSDALRELVAQERERTRYVSAEGISLELYPPGLGLEGPVRLPLLPYLGWRSDWPLPEVRGGRTSRLGAWGRVGLGYELLRYRAPGYDEGRGWGELRVRGSAAVEHYERRGTAGDLGVTWARRSAGGTARGEGLLRAFGLRDRADVDRTGAPVVRSGRFWLRGLVRERTPGEGWLDAEVSRLSDPGLLPEFFRNVALTEKEQETYAHLRYAWDDLAVRVLGRWRINGFQEQVERLPEVRLDWITTPLLVDGTWGGLYLDAALRGGHLRRQFAEGSGQASYRAGRGDFDLALVYKNTVGPLVLRGLGGARETVWSGRASDPDRGINRFAARAGASLSTLLWARIDSPWGPLRHELLPEVGTRHVFAVTQEASALLAFDEVERLRPTDHLYLRLRTRLLADVERRRRPLIDLALEARLAYRDVGDDRAWRWSLLTGDLRLGLAPWLELRARLDHDVNRGRVRQFDATLAAQPWEGVRVSASYRELENQFRAVGWSASWRLTEAWAIGGEQQFGLRGGEFLRHRARLVRFFHRVAVEVSAGYDPLQNDTSVAVAIAPAWSLDDDFGASGREDALER